MTSYCLIRVHLRLQIWARVKQLGMEPTRVRVTSDEAGQYAMPFGAINDNERFK